MSRSRLALAGGAASVAVVAAVVALLASGSKPGDADRLRAAAQAAGAQLVHHDWSYGINDHVDGRVRYPTNPPTNGPHANTWAQDGSYANLEPPATEQVVHAQEHGRIVIQYRPGLPADQIAALQKLYDEDPSRVLLLENRTGMPCPVAATAWGHAILCRGTDARSLDALRSFRDAYRDKGPETVP
jgi:hypothetical protein